MADQNSNQSNQNTSRGQQGQQDNEQGQRPNRDDESVGMGGSRGRSNREPASTADDREMGSELEDDTAIESDIDDVDDAEDIDDLDEGGRSNR